MEKIIIEEGGGCLMFPNPPKGYTVIGTHRTGGGGHRWYAYVKKGVYQELTSLIKDWLEMDSRTFPLRNRPYKVEGSTIIVYDPDDAGSIIGKDGRWVKALSEAIGRRVSVRHVASAGLWIRRIPQSNCWVAEGISDATFKAEELAVLGEPNFVGPWSRHFGSNKAAPGEERLYLGKSLPSAVVENARQREENGIWLDAVFDYCRNQSLIPEDLLPIFAKVGEIQNGSFVRRDVDRQKIVDLLRDAGIKLIRHEQDSHLPGKHCLRCDCERENEKRKRREQANA